jgi:type IV pilus assembly protein PilC
MPKFSYKVRDRDNRVLLGTMDGNSADDIVERLTEMKFLPISVDQLGFAEVVRRKTLSEQLAEGIKRRRDRVPFKDLVFFTRQLGTMVGQGVPISKALDQLQRSEKDTFRRVISEVAEDISTGFTFSDAISRHPSVFNPMFVAVCHSGEVAGALDRVLDGLADYLENIQILRSKVKTAMRYPIFIGGFVFILVLAILIFLVPTFENIYASLNATLPLPTQMLMGVSRIVRNQIPLVILTVGILFILTPIALTRPSVRRWYDKNLLRVPLIGGIFQKIIWAVYSRTMALLMDAGTPILKAIEITSAAVDNKYYGAGLEEVYASLRKGELLSKALEDSGMFPPLVIQLVSTGESSGKVDTLLEKAAEFYEREIRSVVDSLATIIEPFLIIVLGIVVGGILISLYFPILKMGQFIK